jgi:hypothetical protein
MKLLKELVRYHFTHSIADYVHLKNLMVFGAEAVERIMLAYKDISHLSGYTSRVSGFILLLITLRNA